MEIKKCGVCNEQFFPRAYNQLYCSKVCTKKSNVKKPSVEKECKVCGKTYFVYPYQTNISKVCSYKCKAESMKTRVIRTCRYCSKEFSFAPSQIKYYKGAGKYCSRECSYKGIVKSNKDKPINDKYGRSGRKADKEWKEAVRQRDNFTCRRCGIFDKYVHTHHLVMRSQSRELKHVISNGICLCNSCHTWVHHHPKEACESGFLISKKYSIK